MNSQDCPLVSIVTPAYNEERFLRECIESVLSQTYVNWDYTIVNNRSTDGTLAIANEYARSDARIRVHDNPSFVTALQNHNIALRQISPSSTYCKFIGADDYISPRCLEKMVLLAKQHPNIAIVGAYSMFGSRVAPFGPPFPQNVISGREAGANYFLDRQFFYGNPTTLLYSSAVVRNKDPFFNESRAYADAESCLEILKHHDFGFVHEILTFNREREGSLTSVAEASNRYTVEHLAMLEAIGESYLDNLEWKKQLRWGWARYYKYLGTSMLFKRDKDFWITHERDLATLGYKLSKTRVRAHAILSGVEAMLISMGGNRLKGLSTQFSGSRDRSR